LYVFGKFVYILIAIQKLKVMLGRRKGPLGVLKTTLFHFIDCQKVGLDCSPLYFYV